MPYIQKCKPKMGQMKCCGSQSWLAHVYEPPRSSNKLSKDTIVSYPLQGHCVDSLFAVSSNQAHIPLLQLLLPHLRIFHPLRPARKASKTVDLADFWLKPICTSVRSLAMKTQVIIKMSSNQQNSRSCPLTEIHHQKVFDPINFKKFATY